MGKFLKLINVNGFEGVSEPWCNNEGVAVLPFAFINNEYWFLVINEKIPLFDNDRTNYFSTLTGGRHKTKTVKETVIAEIEEETGIDTSNIKDDNFYMLGTYYANKTSIKKWHLCAVDISHLKELDLSKTYYGLGDGTQGEIGINGGFIEETQLHEINDTLALAIYGKLHLKQIIMLKQFRQR